MAVAYILTEKDKEEIYSKFFDLDATDSESEKFLEEMNPVKRVAVQQFLGDVMSTMLNPGKPNPSEEDSGSESD